MSSDDKQFRDLLLRLQGPDDDDVICDLTVLWSWSGGHLQIVTEALNDEPRAKRRAALVRLVWETRSADCVPFLALARADADDRVWKEALDGLVTIGNEGALAVLTRERAR